MRDRFPDYAGIGVPIFADVEFGYMKSLSYRFRNSGHLTDGDIVEFGRRALARVRTWPETHNGSALCVIGYLTRALSQASQREMARCLQGAMLEIDTDVECIHIVDDIDRMLRRIAWSGKEPMTITGAGVLCDMERVPGDLLPFARLMWGAANASRCGVKEGEVFYAVDSRPR
jgi:hypothetical protein